MSLSSEQKRAIHAKRWNNSSEAERQVKMTRIGFGQSADIRGTLTPLKSRKFNDLPTELKDQLIMGTGGDI